MTRCELCERSEPDAQTLLKLSGEFTTDDRTDIVGLKRHLAEEHDLDVGVATLRRHVDEHIQVGLDFTVEDVTLGVDR